MVPTCTGAESHASLMVSSSTHAHTFVRVLHIGLHFDSAFHNYLFLNGCGEKEGKKAKQRKEKQKGHLELCHQLG